ncbi:unnamed protein product, partial [Arabidopsis halleri]
WVPEPIILLDPSPVTSGYPDMTLGIPEPHRLGVLEQDSSGYPSQSLLHIR